MARLTKRERAAIREALAAMLAGEEGAGDFSNAGEDGSYSFEDAESALGKMQEPERTSPQRTSPTRASLTRASHRTEA